MSDHWTLTTDLMLTVQIDVMLQDIGMVTFVKEEPAFVRDMVRAISGNSFLAQRTRQYCYPLLKLPISTRFGTI
jgi:hypothetical protein